MKKSLGRKICWIGSLLIIAFVLINVVLTYFFMAPFSTLFYREQMEDLGDSLEQIDISQEQELKNRIDEIDNSGVKVTMIDENKNVLYTSRAFINENSNYWQLSMELFDTERKKIDKGENVYLTRKRQQKDNKKTIQVIMIQKLDDDYYIIMSRSYQSLQNAMYSALIFDLTVGIFIVLFGWIVVYRLSRYMVVPIQKMTATAEHISNLKFDAKVDVKTADEIGQLGISINKMSEQLEKNLSQLQEDIESRKRLVRNLSHEIKSPIAVIMGYSDRLKAVVSKNPQKALEYCEIIANESARIDILVKEMLELSKMEQQAIDMNKEKIQITALFNGIKERFNGESIGRNIHYEEHYDVTDTVYADYVLLERAVYNLIRNAMTHSVTEELTILITGTRKEEYYEIRVYNSGSFIEEDEISSLWEPFNKVDKVRTRGKNGYGVGLAIVKEIIEAHDGYYSVQNAKDGVEFVIAFKG